MIRTATAVWNGTGRDGKGRLTTDSGVLSDTAYSFVTRFENEKGTNPEELIAAAHAGCFTMALAFGLQRANLTPTELKTSCAISAGRDDIGFKVTTSALTLTATVPGADPEAFAAIVTAAKETCPISRLMNAEIALDLTLT